MLLTKNALLPVVPCTVFILALGIHIRRIQFWYTNCVLLPVFGYYFNAWNTIEHTSKPVWWFIAIKSEYVLFHCLFINSICMSIIDFCGV